MMKHFLEFYNYYKFAISQVSVKHKIFDKLQDSKFLIDNIIDSNHAMYKVYKGLCEMLEFYEFHTHLDKVNTQIRVDKLLIDHSSHDIYRTTLGVNEDFPNSFAADLSLSITNFQFFFSKVGPTEEMVVKCETLYMAQENRMSDSQREQHNIPKLMFKDEQPLLKVQDLCF